MMFCCGSPILQEKVLFKKYCRRLQPMNKKSRMPFCVLLEIILFYSIHIWTGGGNIYNTWANNYYFISGLCFHLNVPTMIATWFFLAFIFTFNNKKGVSWFLSSTTFIEKMRGGKGTMAVIWLIFSIFSNFEQWIIWAKNSWPNKITCYHFSFGTWNSEIGGVE